MKLNLSVWGMGAVFLSMMIFGMISGAMTAGAKPMNPATLEEGIAQSPLIAEAEYQNYSAPVKPVGYFSSVNAVYQLKSILRVAPNSLHPMPGSFVTVSYVFHDGSPCMEPTGWKFSEKEQMPKKGSRWILFLKPGQTPDSKFSTYRGSYGRWPADEAHLQQVKKALNSQH